MEVFVLKLVGIIFATVFAMTIVISRKDDIDIWAVLIACVFELLIYVIIFYDNILEFILKIIYK